jgi:sigma-E factor negative regulatory protein RseA
MSQAPAAAAFPEEHLSALVDGELDVAAAGTACTRWRDDPSVRRNWHAYQWIGDVMRSEDLAVAPARDEAFLQRLRARLADEPAVLAPQPLPASAASAGNARRRWGWMAPSAVAAGFVAVAGTVFVMRAPLAPEGAGLAQSGSAQTIPVSTAAPGAARIVAATPDVATATLIRDARLDRYLAAHKQFVGSSALGAPSGYLRAATVDGTNR